VEERGQKRARRGTKFELKQQQQISQFDDAPKDRKNSSTRLRQWARGIKAQLFFNVMPEAEIKINTRRDISFATLCFLPVAHLLLV
jgi:hypothetical protein